MSIPVEIVGKSSDLADWVVVGAAIVQALGSIAAIIAAAMITNHDRHETAKAADLAKARALVAIMEIGLKNGHIVLAAVRDTVDQSFVLWRSGVVLEAQRQLGRAVAAINSVDVSGLDDERLVSAYFEYADAIALIAVEVSNICARYNRCEAYTGMGPIDYEFQDWFSAAESARNAVLTISRGH